MQDAPHVTSQYRRTSLSSIPRAGTAARKRHPLAREVARILTSYRRRRRLSIEDLASRSGLAAAAIERFESASHAPDINELLTLAAAFGVPAWKIQQRIQDRAARLEDIDARPLRAVS